MQNELGTETGLPRVQGQPRVHGNILSQRERVEERFQRNEFKTNKRGDTPRTAGFMEGGGRGNVSTREKGCARC